MWRFVSGTQRGASFNWHTNCCNTRTHTRHTMFPDRRHRKRAASKIHAVTWKYRKSTFAHADGHLLEWSSSESFITNTHAIYWCMQMWENMRHTHTNTSMQTHSDLYTRWHLASLHNRRLYPKCHPALVAWTHNNFWFKWICCSFNLSISNKKSENTSSVQLTSSQRARSHL